MPLTKLSPWIFIATSLLMTGYFYIYRSTAILYPLLMQSLGYSLTFINNTVYYIEAAGLMLLSHICAGAVSDLVGRKRALILLGALSTIFATAILIDLPSIAPNINTLPTFLGIVGAIANYAYAINITYIAESYPTLSKGLGSGLSYTSGFILGRLAQPILSLLHITTRSISTAAINIAIGQLLIIGVALARPDTRTLDVER